ncbi:MAG: transglutaminase-like domain-containing protein [Ferrovibrionaceae bacterium]
MSMEDAASARAGDLSAYLQATEFLDADHPEVRALADRARAGGGTLTEQAVRLYYLVRDGFLYDPYQVDLSRRGLKASTVIARGRGYCVTKAVLLAAAARALGVPARIGFGDVKNHIATARLKQMMGTDIFYYHGYTELFLDGRWVKATPAFNLELCTKFRVLPLEFDGRHDSLFHPFDADNRRHMEYVLDRGPRADLPYEELHEAMMRLYPGLNWQDGGAPGGDFAAEAAAENPPSA